MFSRHVDSSVDVVLVIPPFSSKFGIGVPLGALTVASILKSAGISCIILDFSLDLYIERESLNQATFDRCTSRILSFKPKIIGFSSQCASMPMTLALAHRLRGLTKAKIIMGGPQSLAAISPGQSALGLELFFDAIFPGADEESFLKYCCHSLNIISPTGSVIFEQRPFPDYSILGSSDLKHYPPVAYIDNARGCSGKCSFCSETHFWGSTISLRSTESTVEHMNFLRLNYGITHFEFTHDNFLQPKAYIRNLLEHLLPYGIDITWHCRTRLETLNPSILSQMKRAGCQSLLTGIETASSMRNNLKNQHIKKTEIESTVKAIIDSGITPTLSFIVGLPDETIADIENTIELALQFSQMRDVTAHIHKFAPLPFSLNSTMRLEYRPNDISDMVFSMPGDAVFNREIETIIAQYPILCGGFYNMPHPFSGSLGLLTEKANHLLYHFSRSFNLWRSKEPKDPINDILSFDPQDEPDSVWAESILRFERARLTCPRGGVLRLRLPQNFLKALHGHEHPNMDQLSDWLLIHRKSGEKQIASITGTEPGLFTQMEHLLKQEKLAAWEPIL